MEDQKIGKHCCICNMKDYLPFTCKNCSKIYCTEHYSEHGCKIIYQPPRPPQSVQKQHTALRCSACKTKIHTVSKHYCQRCQKIYCLKHRHSDSHDCKEPSSCIIY